MGGPKALLRVGGVSFLGRCCRLFQDAAAGFGAEAVLDVVVAVLGAEAERVRTEGGAPHGVRLVVNEGWRDGMLSSSWRGLDAADAAAVDAVLVHPVDHPLLDPATIARVARALAEGALIAVPTWRDRRGHPGGFARPLFPELRSAPPAIGARALLSADPTRVREVAGDPGCVAGIDTPEQFERLLG